MIADKSPERLKVLCKELSSELYRDDLYELAQLLELPVTKKTSKKDLCELIANSLQDSMQNLSQISPSLYTAHKDGLYYVMEKVSSNDERLRFWSDLIEEDKRIYQSRYCNIFYNEENIEKMHKSFIPIRDSRDCADLVSGLEQFERIVNNNHGRYELWIAFVSTKEIKTLSDIAHNNIEMYVTVSTDPEAPMTTHMGINRSLKYLYNAATLWLKDKTLILHPNLSMNLHAFAAKVIKKIYNNKLYMITKPVKVMAEIFIKKLPHDVYIGDNTTILKKVLKEIGSNDQRMLIDGYDYKNSPEFVPIIIDYETYADIGGNGIIKIIDKDRNIIYEQSKSNNKINYIDVNGHRLLNESRRYQWFNEGTMGSRWDNYATINLKALADLF